MIIYLFFMINKGDNLILPIEIIFPLKEFPNKYFTLTELMNR